LLACSLMGFKIFGTTRWALLRQVRKPYTVVNGIVTRHVSCLNAHLILPTFARSPLILEHHPTMPYLTLWKKLSATQLNIAIQVFSLIAIFFEGYDQGVMGGVNASPDYVREVKIGLADGTVTNQTKQGGIVSVVSFIVLDNSWALLTTTVLLGMLGWMLPRRMGRRHHWSNQRNFLRLHRGFDWRCSTSRSSRSRLHDRCSSCDRSWYRRYAS
jgi:hypothetical protein